MGYRKCPSCSGTGNVGLCRPCQGRGYFEFDSADVREVSTKSSNKIVKDINEVLRLIEEAIKDKRLIDNPKRYLYANKAAQSITKEINEVKDLTTLNQDEGLLEECLLKAQKFNEELRLLINKPESSKKVKKSKSNSKNDPRQQHLF
jgi:hypothetical protein